MTDPAQSPRPADVEPSPDPRPRTADVFVEESAPRGQEAPLVEELGVLGFTVRARALPARRPIEQLAWAVLVVLPLQAFLTALGGKAGEDAHHGLRNAVRKVLRRASEAEPSTGPSAEPTGESEAEPLALTPTTSPTVVLQDPATGIRIILGPHLDDTAYRALRALDLTRITQGPVRYDSAEARWLSDVDEATSR
ncbi:hypothetical protein OG601_26060 [Streptomyces sp. NBC_01239]|uniref:hypothetical protein n=1 Tax=Streptomyces sp. NBC_01239 TaxID=2903792 RepID=UPI002258138C|nr:hypothetical protein [Streptomyces sp. NBC_01239]MCX4814069.1 hypothetical protein [Streptomyces sp. NBC_01239]